MRELSFRVNGLPAPQGSKRHVGNGRMIEASKKVGPWRAAVFEAVASLDFEPFANECSIEIVFYLEKPKTVKRILPTVPPDLDKLIRGLLDALTLAHVWLDDALAVDIAAVKIYASEVDPPGAKIIIREIVDPAIFDWANRWIHDD
jgi:crossover junction endodeoxyribonuclease RusA